jgi:hypothetical protein
MRFLRGGEGSFYKGFLGFLVFRRGVFVVGLWCFAWQRWFSDVRFRALNFLQFFQIYFSTA